MLRTHYSSDVGDGKEVKLAGWVDEKRDMGNLVFLVLRDQKGLVQITGKKGNVSEDLLEKMKNLRKESVIVVEGKGIKNEKAPGGIEIIPRSINIISGVKDNLPIDMSEGVKTGLDKRLDARPLDMRRPENQAIFRIESTIVQEMQAFLAKRDFVQVFTPCLMGVASESGSEVFPVMYFDKEAFLRQDPQLHRQLAIASGLEKVYDIGPAWRAEQSHTTRHMCEHRVMAVEMAFIENEYEVMELEQEMVKFALEKMKKDCAVELDLLGVKIDVPRKFPVMEFPKIYDILDEMGEKLERGKEDLSTEGEKKLAQHVKEKHGSDFFFVNRFPFAAKPFYVMRYDNDPTWARSTDLVFKGIELSSGGQREHRYEKIVEQADIKGMPPQSVQWFSDFFKFGVPPHGGFALGIERLTMQLLGLSNVREATLFPRDTERLTP